MARLNNTRHEIVAQNVAIGKTWEHALLTAGYTPKGARSNIGRMSANAGIRARIAELQDELKDELKNQTLWDAKKVLFRLAEIVDANIRDIYDDAGKLKPLKDWPAYWCRLVTRIEAETKYERSRDGGDASWDPGAELMKIHTPDRLKALELIGRHKMVDAFVAQRHQIDLTVNLATEISEMLAAGRARAQLRSAPIAMLPEELNEEKNNNG